MRCWSAPRFFLQRESPLNMCDMLKANAMPWAWPTNQCKDFPGASNEIWTRLQKLGGKMTMLKVSTGFPPGTWVTWHFSWLIYCFSILEFSYSSALFSKWHSWKHQLVTRTSLGLILLFYTKQIKNFGFCKQVTSQIPGAAGDKTWNSQEI